LKENNFKSKRRQNHISWIIFLPTLILVLLSLVSVMFPALILRTLGGFEDSVDIDPFEVGSLAFPLLITNFVIFGLCILYYKNKLPRIISKSLRFIFNFDISSKLAFFVIVIIIGIYIVASIDELFNDVFLDDFYNRGQERLENYDVTKIGGGGLAKHFQLFLNSSSMYIFGNYKIIPFIASIALLALTYFFTFEITQKRFAGIVAMVILLQSEIFLFYDTTVVYPNYWIVFLLLSLYLVYKKWPLSPISYVYSLVSKGMSAIFFPGVLFFIYRSNISKQKKIRLGISYAAIVMLSLTILFLMDFNLGSEMRLVFIHEFKPHEFWSGITTVSTTFRIDGMVLLFLLPLTVGLFVAARRGILHADSIMFFILTMFLYAPLLAAFTWHQHEPYRFVPLMVFFAIGVGVLLSKRVNSEV